MEEFTRLRNDFLFYSDRRSLKMVFVLFFFRSSFVISKITQNVNSQFSSRLFLLSLVSRVMQKFNWSSSLLSEQNVIFPQKTENVHHIHTRIPRRVQKHKNHFKLVSVFLSFNFPFFLSLQKTPKCICFVRAFGFFLSLNSISSYFLCLWMFFFRVRFWFRIQKRMNKQNKNSTTKNDGREKGTKRSSG